MMIDQPDVNFAGLSEKTAGDQGKNLATFLHQWGRPGAVIARQTGTENNEIYKNVYRWGRQAR